MSNPITSRQVVSTAGVAHTIRRVPALSAFVTQSLVRHFRGDWGDLDPEDIATNNHAAASGGRILSSYTLAEPVDVDTSHGDRTIETALWIITEADRSVTTILWPSEY